MSVILIRVLKLILVWWQHILVAAVVEVVDINLKKQEKYPVFYFTKKGRQK